MILLYPKQPILAAAACSKRNTSPTSQMTGFLIWYTFTLYFFCPTKIPESQHGRGWKGPLWVTQPNSLPKQGHAEQAAQHRIQGVLNISREGDSTTSLGSLGQGSVTLRGKKFFLTFRRNFLCFSRRSRALRFAGDTLWETHASHISHPHRQKRAPQTDQRAPLLQTSTWEGTSGCRTAEREPLFSAEHRIRRHPDGRCALRMSFGNHALLWQEPAAESAASQISVSPGQLQFKYLVSKTGMFPLRINWITGKRL